MLNNFGIRSINPIDVFNRHPNMKSIQEDILWEAGKFVIIDGNREPALLIGAMEDRYDFYWIFVKYDLSLCISSCVGGYTLIEYTDDEPKLSVLKYLVEHDLDGLIERIMQKLKKIGRDEEMISDIYFTEER